MPDNNTSPAAEVSDHELLIKIAKDQAASTKHRRIAAIALIVIAAVVVLTAILVLPRLLTLLQNANGAVSQASKILEETEPVVSGLGDVDFDGLNSAIKDLQDAASALASITSIFR